MLKKLNKETYTYVLNIVLADLIPALDNMGISYTILRGADVPVEHEVSEIEFAGRKWTNHFCCLKTNIEPEELKKFTEDLCYDKDENGKYHFKQTSKAILH